MSLTSAISASRIVEGLVNALMVLLPLVSGFIVYFVFSNTGKGFDITDESYYLISALQAADITLSASQFGHYTGLLFSLVGEDIERFRQLGFVVLLLTALWLSISLQSYWQMFTQQQDRLVRVAQHCVITTSVSGYYCEWLVTPSYNWLVLISILFVVIALLETTKPGLSALKRNAYYVLIGISGALVFLAKAPSAVVLVLAVLFWFVFNTSVYKLVPLALMSGLTALVVLILHSLIFDGHIFATYNELNNASDFYQSANAGYTPMEVFRKLGLEMMSLPSITVSKVPFIFLLMPIVAWLSLQSTIRENYRSVLVAGFSMLAILLVWLQVTSAGAWSRLGSGGGYLSIAVVAFALFFLNAMGDTRAQQRAKKLWKPVVLINGLLVLAAFAFAIGTNRTYVGQISMAAVLVTAAAVASALAIDWIRGTRLIAPLVLVLCLVSQGLVMQVVSDRPHRMGGSFSEQTVPVTFLANPSQLYVEPKTAGYLTNLQKIALSAGWRERNLLVDMTGGTSGASFVLGAQTMPLPWLSGRTAHSASTLRFILAATDPVDLASAWILTAPDGAMKNDTAVLNEFDLNFPARYQQVGSATTGHRDELQVLYRPVLSDDAKSATAN